MVNIAIETRETLWRHCDLHHQDINQMYNTCEDEITTLRRGLYFKNNIHKY
jgi:hypothetical protein